MTEIALALAAHTNAGKTTLARTLLGRDVGEVRDAPHVTTEASAYPMLSTPDGDSLVLWDTPGFGDSARLAHRLAQHGNPIGWFLAQVWDRFADQPFYLSQQAVRAVRDRADIVLYLVNAAEAPADAGYLAAELDVLAWIGRPTFVLLNQTGPLRSRAEEEREIEAWRAAIGQRPFVRDVLVLDAFARCWVQEIVLLRHFADAIAPGKRPSLARLIDTWWARQDERLALAMEALAAPIAAAACDQVPLANPTLRTQLRDFVRSTLAEPGESDDRRAAAEALAQRLDAGVRASTDRLIAIHGLDGKSADAIREQLAGFVRAETPLPEGKAALMGGIVTGAVSGLMADLAAGGLTFGAGTLVGAIAGALGGAGIARGYNVMRGQKGVVLRWDNELLDQLVASALLRYLAVAHYGRGRGEWRSSAYPPFWQEGVQREMEYRRGALTALWMRRREADRESLEGEVARLLAEMTRGLLESLYPGALPPGAEGPAHRRAEGHGSVKP